MGWRSWRDIRNGRRDRACSPSYCAADPAIEHLFHYVVVRKDLPLGIMAANIIHAAGESSPGGLHEGTHAVCLSTPNEAALLEVAARLEREGVKITRVVEPDAPYDGALMSIGVAPGKKEDLKRHLSSLPLLR